MIERVQEFVVDEASRARLELLCGPGGAWSRLVATAPGFKGSTLLVERGDPRRHLLIDVWDRADDWQQLQATRSEELAALDAALAGVLLARRELGWFQQRAQAAVRPATPRTARTAQGRSRRRNSHS